MVVYQHYGLKRWLDHKGKKGTSCRFRVWLVWVFFCFIFQCFTLPSGGQNLPWQIWSSSGLTSVCYAVSGEFPWKSCISIRFWKGSTCNLDFRIIVSLHFFFNLILFFCYFLIELTCYKSQKSGFFSKQAPRWSCPIHLECGLMQVWECFCWSIP